MDDSDGEYAPQSPDLSAYHSASYQAPPQPQNSYYQPQPFLQDAYSSPMKSSSNPYPFDIQSQQSYQAGQHPDMGQNGQHGKDPDSGPVKGNRKGKNTKLKVEEDCGKPAPGVEEGIKVTTKFPVARIKRIMQQDDDVGKVAQVTPTAVSKALELFMISLVTKAAAEAKSRSSKRVTAAHLKQAIEKDEQFDFLAEHVANVPDAPAPKKQDSEEPVEGKRKRAAAGGGGGTRRKKKTDDEL